MRSFSVGILLFFALLIGGAITLASLDTEAPTTEVKKTISLPVNG